MIANTLIFLLGMLVTALAAMVLAPVFWRKAQSLARREFEATVPISANEIRAEFDRVRAEAAVSVRRQEVLSAEARTKAAKAEADLGRQVVDLAEAQKRNRRLTQTLEEQDVELEATRTSLARREAENRDLSGQLAQAREESGSAEQEFKALGERLRVLHQKSEEQAIELVAANAKIERLENRLRLSDRGDVGDDVQPDGLGAQRASLPRRKHETSAIAATGRETGRGGRPAAVPAGEPPRSGSPRFEAALGRRELPALDPAAEADIRERISDVAARVIRMTALAEGTGSPLASLLEPGQAAVSPESRPTLADRVRLLAEAERKSAS